MLAKKRKQLSRNATTTELFDEGDIEVFHPSCRTRILILRIVGRKMTSSKLKNGKRDKNPRRGIYVEGICYKCGRYVYLQNAFPSGILGNDD